MKDTIFFKGIGTYFPKKYICNTDTAMKHGYDEKFVKEKIGFKKLLRKDESETVVDFCINAFNDLKSKLDFNNEDIGLVTVVTQNPDKNVPHVSAIVHNELGLSKECMTFDISQGCSGYCHALEIVRSLMTVKNINKSLIFTCDLYSKIIDMDNRDVNMIFGDAATVTLLTLEPGGLYIKDSEFGTLPNSNDCLVCTNSLQMKGNDVFNYACSEVPASIDKLLTKNNINRDEIDYFVFHQGTKFMVEFLKRLMKIEGDKASFSAADIGNTVSSSIPIQLESFVNSEIKVKNIVISGFGVGFTWGNILLKK